MGLEAEERGKLWSGGNSADTCADCFGPSEDGSSKQTVATVRVPVSTATSNTTFKSLIQAIKHTYLPT